MKFFHLFCTIWKPNRNGFSRLELVVDPVVRMGVREVLRDKHKYTQNTNI